MADCNGLRARKELFRNCLIRLLFDTCRLLLMQIEWRAVKPVVIVKELDVSKFSRERDFTDWPAWRFKIGTKLWFLWHFSTMQVQAYLFRNAQFSRHCWIRNYTADVLHMCLCWPSVIVNYGYIFTVSLISGTKLPGRMNPDSSFITLMNLSMYAIFQVNCWSPNFQQLICRSMVAVL